MNRTDKTRQIDRTKQTDRTRQTDQTRQADRARQTDQTNQADHIDQTGSFRKMIADQYQLDQTKGSYGPLGKVSVNGCGMLALYNTLQLMGYDISYHTVYGYIRKHWWKNLLFGGLMGTNPLFVFGQLKRITGSRPDWKIYFGKRDLKEWMKPGVYLFLYLHRHGAHYAAARQTKERLIVYNDIHENKNLPDYYRKIHAKGMLIARLEADEV